jgi:hypothetical protein
VKESNPDSQINDDVLPRFIIIEYVKLATPVAKLSPFAIEKGIPGISGTAVDVTKDSFWWSVPKSCMPTICYVQPC